MTRVLGALFSDTLSPCRLLRTFFGVLTSCTDLGCHPIDDTQRLSTVPGVARHRMVAGPMGHGARSFVRHRGVLTDARQRCRKLPGMRDRRPGDHSLRPSTWPATG